MLSLIGVDSVPPSCDIVGVSEMGLFDWLKRTPLPSAPAAATPPKLLNVREFAESNADIVKGWRLYVTMNTATPLEWLKRHGERANQPTDVPENLAVWLPVSKSFRELGLDIDEMPETTVASAIGPIPESGGEFLDFLKAYRSIVEADIADAKRFDALTNLNDEFPAIVKKMGGNLVEFFYLYELRSQLSCGPGVASKLFNDGLRTSEQVRESSIERLCSIKGIGKGTAEQLLS